MPNNKRTRQELEDITAKAEKSRDRAIAAKAKSMKELHEVSHKYRKLQGEVAAALPRFQHLFDLLVQNPEVRRVGTPANRVWVEAREIFNMLRRDVDQDVPAFDEEAMRAQDRAEEQSTQVRRAYENETIREDTRGESGEESSPQQNEPSSVRPGDM